MTAAQSLASKYFILHGPLIAHGQILGPVHDLAPVYLCRIYPHNLTVDGAAESFAPGAERLMDLSTLSYALLYDDYEIMRESWREFVVGVKAAQEAAATQAKVKKGVKTSGRPQMQKLSRAEIAEVMEMLGGGATDEADDA